MSTAQLIESIKALPLEEKNALFDIIAADIVDSTPADVRQAQVDEVVRRRQAWLDGKTELLDGDEVMRELRDKVQRPK